MIKDNQIYLIIFGVLLVIILIINLCRNKKEPFINQNNEGIESFSNYETFYANKNDLCEGDNIYDTAAEKKIIKDRLLKPGSESCKFNNKDIPSTETELKNKISEFKNIYKKSILEEIKKEENKKVLIGLDDTKNEEKEIILFIKYLILLLENIIFKNINLLLINEKELSVFSKTRPTNDGYDNNKNNKLELDFNYITANFIKNIKYLKIRQKTYIRDYLKLNTNSNLKEVFKKIEEIKKKIEEAKTAIKDKNTEVKQKININMTKLNNNLKKLKSELDKLDSDSKEDIAKKKEEIKKKEEEIKKKEEEIKKIKEEIKKLEANLNTQTKNLKPEKTKVTTEQTKLLAAQKKAKADKKNLKKKVDGINNYVFGDTRLDILENLLNLFKDLELIIDTKASLYHMKKRRCLTCGFQDNKKCECYAKTSEKISDLLESQKMKDEIAANKKKAADKEAAAKAAAAKAATPEAKAAAAKAAAAKAAAAKAAAAKAAADKEAAAKAAEDKKKAAHKNAEEQQKRSLSQGEILLEREIASVKTNIHNLELQLNDVRRKEQIKNQFDLKRLKDKERILEQELNNNINKLDQLSSAEKNKILLSQSGKGYASYPIAISFRPIAIFGEKGVTERMMTNYDFDDQDVLNQKDEFQNNKGEFGGYVGNICKNYLEL